MPKKLKLKSIDDNEFTFTVHDLIKNTSDMASFLTSEWCTCGPDSEFLCYPDNGCCSCGTHKHHVHCKHCGGISQIG